METNTAERTTQAYEAILLQARELRKLLGSVVTKAPHYFWPFWAEGEALPMTPDDYQWLQHGLGRLIEGLEEELSDEDEW